MSNMHLTRLKVEQLRQFRNAYVLDGLTPGLNIFSGPNEAGKSTLVRAIRAAFPQCQGFDSPAVPYFAASPGGSVRGTEHPVAC